MFSKNWLDRETSLRQLTRTASRALLLGVGEGLSGVVISQNTQDTTRTMLDCCFSVLAYMLADPVYKVFVAGLVSGYLFMAITCIFTTMNFSTHLFIIYSYTFKWAINVLVKECL